MTPITFDGKTYKSESEMPQDVWQAYQEDQVHKTIANPLAEDVGTPQDVGKSPSLGELPITGELQRPSAARIDRRYSTSEPDSSLLIRGLIFGIIMSLIVVAIVLLVIEFFRQLL